MTVRICCALLLVSLGASAESAVKGRFERAEEKLRARAFLDVFDLVGAGPWTDRARAGRLLAQSAGLAFESGELDVASLLCERALVATPSEDGARVLCMQVALAQKRYPEVEELAEGLGPKAAAGERARRIRAEAAAGLQNWTRVVALLEDVSGPEAAALRDRALEAQRLAEETVELGLEERLARAVEEARALDRLGLDAERTTESAKVVAYVTSWCPSCRALTAYLQKERIPHEVKDVEASHTAREAYVRACRKGGFEPGSVPVVEVNGRIVRGFDRRAIEAALR